MLLFLTGCGGVMDYESPGIHIHGTVDRQTAVRYVQPYNRRNMIERLKASGTADVPEHRKGVIEVERGGMFVLELSGFRRGGAFWVIPPLGSLGLDFDSEVILFVDGFSPRGIVADEDRPVVYYFDTEKRKVIEDHTGFIVIESVSREQRDDPINQGAEDMVDIVRLKINNSQPRPANAPSSHRYNVRSINP
ncbi:MAG TPA: hypothetical protein VIS99_01450 [Terrimicrobiaceae bacterium]